jgi:predicted nucleotidyltransferase
MDIRSLLESLNENKSRYVVIGAMAFPHHGYARATLDIDIFIEPSEENAQRTLKALTDFGFDTSDLSVPDLVRYKVLIRDYAVQVDVHPFVAGVGFDEVEERSEETTILGVPVRVPCLDDLIQMKQAAGRTKDLEDLKFLQALRKRR